MARPKNCGKCNKPKRPRGKKFKDAPGYCKCGRPSVIDENTVNKLKDAFMNAFSDEQACAYAGITKPTLYRYEEENPGFRDQKRQLKLRPDLKAKQTIVGSLGDVNQAKWWMERRDPEFKPTSKVEHEGAVEILDSNVVMSDDEKQALDALRQARRKRIEDQIKEKAKQE